MVATDFDPWCPWVQAARFEPRPLGVFAIMVLLRDWSEENIRISLLPSNAAFAKHVHSLTAGHLGLTGLCLNRLTSWAERQGQLTLAEWSRSAISRLPRILDTLHPYRLSEVDKMDGTPLNLLDEVSFQHPEVSEYIASIPYAYELDWSRADAPSLGFQVRRWSCLLAHVTAGALYGEH